MDNFTLENYSEILKLENQLINEISSGGMREGGLKIPKPGQRAIDNILAYSKMVSFRKTKSFGTLKLMLN